MADHDAHDLVAEAVFDILSVAAEEGITDRNVIAHSIARSLMSWPRITVTVGRSAPTTRQETR